jgi:glycosyltransferase involved in cell wall biosynthesis
MKILLVLNHPHSSLDVLAQATVVTLEKHGIEVFWLYRQMFFKAVEVYPEIFSTLDLVHFLHGVETFPYEVIAQVSQQCPIISSYHHCEFQEAPRQFELVNKLFFVSRFLKDELYFLGVLSEKMTPMYSGVDTEIFYPSFEGRPIKDFLIGFFGSQSPKSWDRKGSVLLVQAVRRIVDLGYRPSFLIVGYGWKKLVGDLRNMGLKIFYKVNVPFRELPQLYRRLDLYLITSILEGGPLTLLEAGASGVPIISTPVGLSLEILSQSGCGKLLKGFDSDEIAAAVIDDIEHQEQAKERASFLLKEIRQHWDWKYTYKDVHKTYLEIAKIKQSLKKVSTSWNYSLVHYLDFEKSSKQQREIARQCALVDLALRLHDHGDLLAAYRIGLPLLIKVNPLYWWQAFKWMRDLTSN